MSRPRLRHVAEMAGVSEATVSRVVNDRDGVAEPTRRRVLNALNQLGYAPVGLGRLHTRTGLIGMIVPELDNPVFPAFAQAIEQRLAREQYTTMLCTSTPAGMQEADYLELLVEHQVAGVVIVSGVHADTTADHARYAELDATGLPMVLLNGRADGIDLPAVAADDRAAARTAVAHLAQLGHTRIGLALGRRRFVPAVRKLEGFLDGLEAAGLAPDPELVSETLFTVEGGEAAANDLLDHGATAVVCSSDLMALGALRAARARGVDVPGEVSIVGYDDAGPATWTTPGLTTLRQPIDDMGAAAVRTLVDAIGGRDVRRGEYLFRCELVVRESTGPAPR